MQAQAGHVGTPDARLREQPAQEDVALGDPQGSHVGRPGAHPGAEDGVLPDAVDHAHRGVDDDHLVVAAPERGDHLGGRRQCDVAFGR